MRISALVIGLAAAIGILASGASATTLQKLRTQDDADRWEAVGRLNFEGSGFCTAALISETLVLTAAHCVFDRDTAAIVDPARVEFLAGWRDGRAAASRGARRILVHPAYDYAGADRMMRVATDIAIIELDRPIRSANIQAFETFQRPVVGDDVTIVSYARERAEAPSMEEDCRVLGRDPAVLVLSCEVNFGASGSPIFVVSDGVPRIASVVSAKAVWNERKVALGAALGEPLQELLDTMASGDGVFRRVESVSSGGAGGKAKFLKP